MTINTCIRGGRLIAAQTLATSLGATLEVLLGDDGRPIFALILGDFTRQYQNLADIERSLDRLVRCSQAELEVSEPEGDAACLDSNDAGKVAYLVSGTVDTAISPNHEFHLIAALKRYGMTVHRLAYGGYLVCRWDLSHYCSDIHELTKCVKTVGAA